MEELDYYWKKVQKITDPEELVKEKENLLEVALLDQIFQLLLWLLLKKGEKDIDGLTTIQRPNRLHVKRATKIRKLYNLTKEDDVKFYISKIGREIEKKKEGSDKKKNRVKRPKIQRLITDVRLRRKKIQKAEAGARRERTKKLKEEYHTLVTKLRTKHAEAKHEETKATETKHAPKKGEEKKATTTAKGTTAKPTEVKKGQEKKVVAPTTGKTTTTTTTATKPTTTATKPAT